MVRFRYPASVQCTEVLVNVESSPLSTARSRIPIDLQLANGASEVEAEPYNQVSLPFYIYGSQCDTIDVCMEKNERVIAALRQEIEHLQQTYAKREIEVVMSRFELHLVI